VRILCFSVYLPQEFLQLRLIWHQQTLPAQPGAHAPGWPLAHFL
jgi:hypothetical protein